MIFEEFNKPFSFNADKVKAKQKKIHICNGSDCTKRGTQTKLRRELEKFFKTDEIGTYNCIGLCHKNYAFRYKEQNYSASSAEELRKIIKNG